MRNRLLRIGAHNRNRTDDLFLTKEVLYRLSYVSVVPCCVLPFACTVERVMGIEPTSVAWKATALPLSYTRLTCPFQLVAKHCGGERRIRTFVDVSQQIYSLPSLAT